jgi:L-lactate dehydrogenase
MKIGIVGCGFVGATAAYALVMSGVGREIVMIDLNRARAEAEAADILHAVPFAHDLAVRAGEYHDLAGSQVVIMTAGVGQKPGETRIQLLERNAAVFRSVIPQIYTHAPEAVLVVATNPVDVMTHLSARYAADFGIPPNRVVGSGTTLDTARFRALLGQFLGVDPTHIHAYVLGEHGDSEVLTWSLVNVGTVPLEQFCRMQGLPLTTAEIEAIDQSVRKAAYRIIEGKGATYYGVGSALARITRNILGDRRALMTVCTPTPYVAGVEDVTVSLPRLVGGNGVLETFPVPLSEAEETALHHSARLIRDLIDQLESTQSHRNLD